MTKTIFDLPEELVAEILSRIPLGIVRSTCKKWNALSRNWIFGKVPETKIQFLGFMIHEEYFYCESIYSVRIDLQGIRKNGDDSIDISIKHGRKDVTVYKAYQCDGLLLLWIRNSPPRLAVWNPYLGQTRFIPPISNAFYSFALGYDNSHNHKILFILDFYQHKNNGFNIYEFKSDSWRVLDLAPKWKITTSLCVTLKGNAYFYAHENEIDMEGVKKMKHFLLCFDFTSERFGPRLSLPFHDCCRSNVILLYCVRDKQLAVLLHQPWRKPEMFEIWVTNRIDYNEVSWTKWMQVDTDLVGSINLKNLGKLVSFFIDEEKKVVVVFDQARRKDERCVNETVHIIREDGYFKSIDIGKGYGVQPMFGYFPSLVQIQ